MKTSPCPMRVLVAHRAPVVAAGLRVVLAERADLELLPEDRRAGSSDGEAADVVVADLWSTEHLAEEGVRAPRMLIVGDAAREVDVRQAFQRGASGFVLLGGPVEEIVNAVMVLGQGGRYLCREASATVASSMTHDDLTGREMDVLRLLAVGYSNKAIAKLLDISLGTVKSHVRPILVKLQARCRTEAVAVATQRGLVDTAAGLAGTRLPQHDAAPQSAPAGARRAQVSATPSISRLN